MPSIDYSHIADLYDSYVTTALDIPFYLDQAKGYREVLELMSGTGRVSIPLLEAGVHLTCVDSSTAMLARLRAKAEARGLHPDVQEVDVCRLDLGKRFDLIVLPFHSFSEIVDLSAQRKALARIGEHLGPKGRFICPLHNPPARFKLIDGVKRVRGKFAAGTQGETLRPFIIRFPTLIFPPCDSCFSSVLSVFILFLCSRPPLILASELPLILALFHNRKAFAFFPESYNLPLV